MKRPNAHLMLLPLQGATAPTRGPPGCRYACPGLGAPLGLQPALANTTCCSTVDNEVVFWPCNSLSITDIEMATMIFRKGGLKAQWSTQPRASVATPPCWSSRALKGQKHYNVYRSYRTAIIANILTSASCYKHLRINLLPQPANTNGGDASRVGKIKRKDTTPTK